MPKTTTTTKGSKTGAASTSNVKMERQAIVRAELMESQGLIESNYMKLSELLFEAHRKEFYGGWGFEDFKDYCLSELDIHYRKAMYLIEIWDKVKTLKLPKAKVKKLGWTKMKDLCYVINEENAKEWLAKADKMSSREVTDEVKVHRQKDGTDRRPATTTLKIQMKEAEMNIITDAIEEAKKLVGADDTALALEMICQDWMAEKGAVPASTTIDNQVAYLEQVYGCKITVKAGKKPAGKKKAETVAKAEKKGADRKAKASKDTKSTKATKAKGKAASKKAEEAEDAGGAEQDIDDLLGL